LQNSSSGQGSLHRGRFARRRGSYNQFATNQIDENDENNCSDGNEEESTVSGVTVCAINSSKQMKNRSGAFKSVCVNIADQPVTLTIDLGSKVSILNKQLYEQLFQSRFTLLPPTVTLRAYGGKHVIPCLGCIEAPVQFCNSSVPSFRFYITQQGDSMLGVDLFDKLHGVVLLEGVEVNATTTSECTVLLSQFPSLIKSSGRLRGFIHKPHVDLSVPPVQARFYHQPLAMRAPISAEIKRMLDADVIERIESSPWISNIVTAIKRDGGVRVCVNMSAPNKALIPECFPLPTMEELTSKVAGSTVFSKLDLLWGYTQLELDRSVRDLTAFVCHDGVFRFKTVVFGMSTGPSAFQAVIRKMLEGLEGCENILDDILIHGNGMKEHDDRLRCVLRRLVKYNATVRVDKCVVGKSEVDFNGHRVSAEGVRPLQSNVDAILKMPVPTDQKHLTRFLCTAGYYLKFLPGYADLCEPLRALLKKEAVWCWSPMCQRNFDEIKRRIASPPTLAHFDVAAPTRVTADSSAYALGACLSQIQDGVERPVAFASRTLSLTERRYSASEREALAALWACERWHFYLYGRRFTLVSDHQALRTLLAAGGTGHRPLRLHRWSSRLLRYSFDVVFKPGAENVVADCLSRAYVPESSMTSSDVPEADTAWDDDAAAAIQSVFGGLGVPVVSRAEVAQATAADPVLTAIMGYIVEGWPSEIPSELERPETASLYSCRHELSILHQCIVRSLRTFIPVSLRSQVLSLLHEGHNGIVRTKQLARESVWWPGIDVDIERMIRNCAPCTVSGKAVRPVPGPLQPLSWPSGPWKRVALDIAGEFTSAPHHQRFIMVAVDHYSKWPEVAVSGTVTSAAVIEFLTSLFERFGLIEELTTDNGVQFTSSEFQAFLHQHNIRHCRSALYAPQSQGLVERMNRVIKDGVKVGLAEGLSFIASIRRTLATYRMTPHSTTGVTPSSLMLAFKARTPLTILSADSQIQDGGSLRQRVEQKQRKMKQRHDRKFRARQTIIEPGDLVRIMLPRRSHKLAAKYSNPFPVGRVSGNTVYLVDGRRWNLRRCIRHQAAKDSESSQAAPSADMSSESESEEAEDSPQFLLPAVDQPAVPVLAAPVAVRRSTRVRRQVDFGPVLKHSAQ
jgi:hypothetical protein